MIMKPRILVTKRIPEAGLKRLAEVFEVHLNEEERTLSHTEILHLIPGFDALLCLLTDRVDADVIRAGKHLKCISNYAVGFNNIDLEAARSQSIIVCNTPGVLTETTADLAWALLMAAARLIPESDSFVRNNLFTGWEPMLHLGMDIHGKRLGLIGMGRIGIAMAHRALGFNMQIQYYEQDDYSPPSGLKATKTDLETLLKTSDFISIHTPLTPETKHLIGTEQFSMMKPTAVLVNTARGAILDEKALVQALLDRTIFAAGLDVYEYEPELVSGLKDLPNAVLVAHIGSASIETRTRMAMLAAENAIAVIEGKEPPAGVI